MELIILFLILAFIALGTWRSLTAVHVKRKRKIIYYLRESAFSLGMVLMVYILYKPVFDNYFLDGINDSRLIKDELLFGLASAFTVLFFLSLTPWFRFPSGHILKEQTLMGYPVENLPEDFRQWLVFAVYIAAGVVLEEFIFRQFLFYAIHQVTGWEGDVLVLITAVIFGAAHLYQGWPGVLSNLVFGLVLGYLFLKTGDIRFPIGLHLIHNFALVNLAGRRILALRKWNADN